MARAIVGFYIARFAAAATDVARYPADAAALSFKFHASSFCC